ncbi:MAG: F0F1 ATP synthase subunit A [Coriobacteriales bacterium]|nr:F0F1 ATP synthase subunit A [Coriobacteriales bacterium]
MNFTGDPLSDISAPIEELSTSLRSPGHVIDFGNGVYLTPYIFWLIIVLLLVCIGVTMCVKKVTLVPKNKFAGLVEYGYDAVRRNMGQEGVGHGYEKHLPFLASLFFFVLFANIVGLVPSFRTPTGTLSVTWALALVSFIYFNVYGFKVKGAWGYIKSIAPKGLPAPLVPIIWVFEFVSLILRLLTLAVRLYGNMFAGHMILGIFAIMTQAFLIDAFVGAAPLLALPAVIWFLFLVLMYALECLVAFLQAYVFTILSAVYIGLAQSEH